MTTWSQFPAYAYAALALWSAAVILMGFEFFIQKNSSATFNARAKLFSRGGMACSAAGLFIFAMFMAQLWISLERPPLRTLGETRLWYAFLLPAVGLLAEYRWRLTWMRAYAIGMASLFIVLNLTMPETHDKSLAPALQSLWFVPHVAVYLLGYAFLGGSALVAAHGLYLDFRKKESSHVAVSANVLATLGFVFINCGILFGAFWAKEAWGHYWSWDPKETWAFLTWLAYLIYLHITSRGKVSNRAAFVALALGFVVLLICWFGMSYLATADQSVHSYRN